MVFFTKKAAVTTNFEGHGMVELVVTCVSDLLYLVSVTASITWHYFLH
jgi:hypothetical protein